MEILRDQDPIVFFQNWLKDAEKSEVNDPEAMSLATLGADGMPSVRIILMKGADSAGFRFFTNGESHKAQDIAHNPVGALCFHWKSLRRQVRVQGHISSLPDQDVEAYFATRHPLSQIGTWASQQSQPLESRAVLEARVAEFEKKFAGGDVPKPPYWAGYLLAPTKIEFWQQGESRLHDRFLFVRQENGTGAESKEKTIWDVTRLCP